MRDRIPDRRDVGIRFKGAKTLRLQDGRATASWAAAWAVARAFAWAVASAVARATAWTVARAAAWAAA